VALYITYPHPHNLSNCACLSRPSLLWIISTILYKIQINQLLHSYFNSLKNDAKKNAATWANFSTLSQFFNSLARHKIKYYIISSRALTD
jgi:hypothetical protein